ncbi:Uncharacterised protein [Mycobacteroides abscessus subsp. abscessus]|uniref:hypothetical protein n=1 Tax=Mycobacteroides abscessus TaxID=36809 RepID=UPI000929307F|nr:hypothetical protein [Mycobacteroides abscessus]MBN7438659.1 hypothetical protein [Mycobacteroides abscessus subsp. abscessus]MBN7442696.1 hypothetical protein [Mycobacteroides abscessus subsp. abscessus]MBN7561521.1 hypothetical protein [Mycobacteroides abscessus subsp. abscessus]MDM2349272.1 hypothetical protein [Mycobacteroides abscessus]MDM2360154.1 hypothetical protein [Mycobacteroides abscessus]
MLSAERRFQFPRSLEEISAVSDFELPSADDIEPGNHAPLAFADTARRLDALSIGDTFTTQIGIAGLMTPIEWVVVEITDTATLLAVRRGRYQVASQGLQGANATVVLNVYEQKPSVVAELFVLIDEVILTGELQQSFMAALEGMIDTHIELIRTGVPGLRDVIVDEAYPPPRGQGR